MWDDRNFSSLFVASNILWKFCVDITSVLILGRQKKALRIGQMVQKKIRAFGGTTIRIHRIQNGQLWLRQIIDECWMLLGWILSSNWKWNVERGGFTMAANSHTYSSIASRQCKLIYFMVKYSYIQPPSSLTTRDELKHKNRESLIQNVQSSQLLDICFETM